MSEFQISMSTQTIPTLARAWRDRQLEGTDSQVMIPDYPNRDNIILYRVALRDWPASDDFPTTRPQLGE